MTEQTSEPRTAAGLAMVEAEKAYPGHAYHDRILRDAFEAGWISAKHAIEAEAAALPAAPAGLDVPDYPDDFNPYLHQTLTRLASKWRDESKWDGRGDIYLRCADELDRVAAAYAEGEPER